MADAQRLDNDLRAAGAECTWIDWEGSQRLERTFLLSAHGTRHGDTLVVLSRRHLGDDPDEVESLLAKRGVNVIVWEPEAPARKKSGPAPKFNPDPRQEARIRHYWHGDMKRSVVLDKIAEIMGYPVHQASLNWHLGPRSKPKPILHEDTA